MRGTAVVIFIAAIFLLAAWASPHDGDDDDYGDDHLPAAAPTVPSNGTPDSGNPKMDYSTTVKEHGDMDKGDFGLGSKEDGMDGMDMDDMGDDHPAHNHNSSVSAPISPEQMSYWLWPEHRGLLYAHISIMIVSWGFLLPVGRLPQSCPRLPFPATTRYFECRC